jgi:hypothetical protein
LRAARPAIFEIAGLTTALIAPGEGGLNALGQVGVSSEVGSPTESEAAPADGYYPEGEWHILPPLRYQHRKKATLYRQPTSRVIDPGEQLGDQ